MTADGAESSEIENRCSPAEKIIIIPNLYRRRLANAGGASRRRTIDGRVARRSVGLLSGGARPRPLDSGVSVRHRSTASPSPSLPADALYDTLPTNYGHVRGVVDVYGERGERER